jgi:hypothetical protein
MTSSITAVEHPKLQPHNLEAEQCVLGAILLDNATLAKTTEVITDDDFYWTPHKTVYRAMVNLAEHGEVIDPITLSERLKKSSELEAVGGAAYLAELIQLTPSTANIHSHCKIIQEKAILRRAGGELVKAVHAAYSGMDVAALAARVTHIQTILDQGPARSAPILALSSWPVMDAAAYHGLAGKLTKVIAPHSEADPVGILLHTLTAAGCLIGLAPHVMVERTPHPARLNVLFVGRTAGGRKGMAWSTPRYVLSKVDERWVRARVKSGLSSGEGLIYQVRDTDGEDAGESDKRLLLIESEFGGTLKVMEREGNTLSPVIRDAWDHGNLSPLTKKDRISAMGAHVSLIGHITQEELLRSLTATERANGFANRFLFALVKRSQFLPSGKGAPDSALAPYFTPLMRTIESAKQRGEVARDRDAEDLWGSVYARIEEEIPGLTGAILGRGAAQVLRMSLLYSLLDETEAARPDPAIRAPHLLAALAVWDYCRASVLHVFGDALGDPDADRLLRLIRQGPQSDTALYEAMGKHGKGAARKDRGLDLLVRLDRVHAVTDRETGGRPATWWHLGPARGCALCAKRG